MSATVLPPEPLAPTTIHNCPSCSHWLPDGTLACPECQALTYGQHLSRLAAEAQALEQQQLWVEARDRWRSALQWLPGDTRQASSVSEHIAVIDARLKAVDDQKARWSKRLGPFAPIALFLLKAKSALFFLFKLKFFFSLFAFFGLYWAMFGWKFAVGFTASLFVHEMGHFVAAKRRGLKADLPIFMPGLGAYVRWYSMGVSREDLASIALAGPVFGLVAALACFALYQVTHSPLLLMIANVGAWINLFNLVPILGLDGAQATYALSRMQRGLLTATCLLFFGLSVSANGGELFGPHTQWVFFFISAGMTWRCFTNDTPEKPDTKTFVYFLGLILSLGFLLFLTPVAGLTR
jgi:Zn-dependent protease